MNPVEEKRPDEKLGEFIARVRQERGMSVEELSVVTKVAAAYIRSIEAGEWKSFPVAAYVRGYLNSISAKLNLNPRAVLTAFAAESGNALDHEFDDVSSGQKIKPLAEGENKKRSMAVPVVIVLLIVGFLVASHFLNLVSLTEEHVEEPEVKNPAVVVDSTESQEIADGAEAIPADSMDADTAAVDSSSKNFSLNVSVSQAVVDSALKKSDLPASATIFISSDSKNKAAAENAVPKTTKTNFMLIGSGEALSWVGLKRREDANSFLKEANISKAGVKMVYNTNDTLCVTIGEPKAISKMLLNGVETPLPEMKFGRVTRFRVFGGVIVK